MKLLRKLYSQNLVILFVMVLGLSSCQQEADFPDPRPREENPTPIEEKVLLKRIQNAPNDFQTFEYDGQGNILKYATQYTYSASGAVRQNSHVFEYDEAKKLIKVASSYGYSKYFYKDGKLEKTETYYTANNQLISTIFYTFNDKQQLVSALEVVAKPFEDSPSEIKRTFLYDEKGNLTQQAHLFLNKNNAFELIYTVFYEDYDDKKSVDNQVFFYPYLPKTKFFANNYRRLKTVYANGAIDEHIYLFDYQYNNKGFPSSKTQSVANRPDVTSIRFEYSY
ncbi:MAG: hypothetical protein MUE81_12180 [Thermoflexibacter sp.]|nr:hypothetical protein [Thermoflexibacter sp.]